MIIDAHVHLGGPDQNDGRILTAEQLISHMDVCSIDRAVVFPFDQPQQAFSPANDHIARAVNEYPDRLIGFARLNPNDGTDALLELDRVHGMGHKGIKLHPTVQDFTVDNHILHLIAEKARDYGMTLIFDTGKSRSRPEHMESFARDHPDIHIIMAHMYGDFIPALLSCPNLSVQTTAMPRRAVIEMAVQKIGAHRISMGSDHPYLNMCAETDKVQGLAIHAEDKAFLLGRSIQHILGL